MQCWTISDGNGWSWRQMAYQLKIEMKSENHLFNSIILLKIKFSKSSVWNNQLKVHSNGNFVSVLVIVVGTLFLDFINANIYTTHALDWDDNKIMNGFSLTTKPFISSVTKESVWLKHKCMAIWISSTVSFGVSICNSKAFTFIFFESQYEQFGTFRHYYAASNRVINFHKFPYLSGSIDFRDDGTLHLYHLLMILRHSFYQLVLFYHISRSFNVSKPIRKLRQRFHLNRLF